MEDWTNQDGDNSGGYPTATDTSNRHLLAQKSTALLLLTLKERHRLTQTAVNFSVGQMKQTMMHVLDDVKESVKRKLGSDVEDIDKCFDVDIFQGLNTEYFQTVL